MKKFSLKFILFIILSVFSSFTYADGVFSNYHNTRFAFSVEVPVEKYVQPTQNGEDIVNLDFVKISKSIPTKDYFNATGAMNNDGINIKDKNEHISIIAYGTNLLSAEEIDGLNKETVKSSFENENLNYTEFIKKYYNGELPQNTDPLKFNYNKDLFINGNNVAYNTIGKDFYVVSYIKDNKIYYKKVIYNKDENYYAIFEASYLPKDKKFMDSIINEMVKSFKLIK